MKNNYTETHKFENFISNKTAFLFDEGDEMTPFEILLLINVLGILITLLWLSNKGLF